ncbi:hypothetical protein [Klebsiella grimontii]|uniref:hypothetical protein n=1 Tax=Klebsiella grimontii TaxID=2058152 RepID=UPI002115C23E|nr:hypothetical protein [Klebsiella grimontii]
MKAAGYDVQGAPGVLKYVDIPDPVAEPDDVLISVEAISIEGGSDQPPFDAASLSSWVVGYAAAGSLTVDLWSPMQSNFEALRDIWGTPSSNPIDPKILPLWRRK